MRRYNVYVYCDTTVVFVRSLSFMYINHFDYCAHLYPVMTGTRTGAKTSGLGASACIFLGSHLHFHLHVGTHTHTMKKLV